MAKFFVAQSLYPAGSSMLRCRRRSAPRVIAVVTELPLRLTTSAGSACARPASDASVLGRTTPGSYPAKRTASSYSTRTACGMAVTSTRASFGALPHDLVAEAASSTSKGTSLRRRKRTTGMASANFVGSVSKSSSNTRAAASGTTRVRRLSRASPHRGRASTRPRLRLSDRDVGRFQPGNERSGEQRREGMSWLAAGRLARCAATTPSGVSSQASAGRWLLIGKRNGQCH